MHMGIGQYNGQGVYCDLSTASEVFLIFTTHLYSCVCKCDAVVVDSLPLLTSGKY